MRIEQILERILTFLPLPSSLRIHCVCKRVSLPHRNAQIPAYMLTTPNSSAVILDDHENILRQTSLQSLEWEWVKAASLILPPKHKGSQVATPGEIFCFIRVNYKTLHICERRRHLASFPTYWSTSQRPPGAKLQNLHSWNSKQGLKEGLKAQPHLTLSNGFYLLKTL